MLTSIRFHELDITLTLKENFENKVIIEFPIIYIILKDHSDMYEIIDTGTSSICINIFRIIANLYHPKLNDFSDDENVNDAQCDAGNGNVGKRRKRRYNRFNENQKVKEKNSPVNFFFTSEFSESEEEMVNNEQNNRRLVNFNIPDYDDLVKMEQ